MVCPKTNGKKEKGRPSRRWGKSFQTKRLCEYWGIGGSLVLGRVKLFEGKEICNSYTQKKKKNKWGRPKRQAGEGRKKKRRL